MSMDKFERYAAWLDSRSEPGFRALFEAGLHDIRTLNCAVYSGIEKIEDFTKLTERDLIAWPNFGRRSLQIVQEVLGRHGLALNEGHQNDETLKLLIAMANQTRAELRQAGENHKASLAAVELRKKQLAALDIDRALS